MEVLLDTEVVVETVEALGLLKLVVLKAVKLCDVDVRGRLRLRLSVLELPPLAPSPGLPGGDKLELCTPCPAPSCLELLKLCSPLPLALLKTALEELLKLPSVCLSWLLFIPLLLVLLLLVMLLFVFLLILLLLLLTPLLLLLT